MLDCFPSEMRDELRSDSMSLVRQLVDPAVRPTAQRTLSVHTSVSFTNGVKDASVSKVVELRAGALPPRTVTIKTKERATGWYVVEVRDGVHESDAWFAEHMAQPPAEADGTLASRSKSGVVVDASGASDLPPAGTPVDVFVVGRQGPGGTTMTLAASGKVKRLEGKTVHVDVSSWAPNPAKGKDPLVRSAPLLLRWIPPRAQRP